jgi:hypothetical protein
MIKSYGRNDSDGWVSIGGVTPQVYDLLDLTGGVNVLLIKTFLYLLGKYV